MLIQVIYQDDKRCGAVHRSRLDSLIRSGRLFAFRRANGWVIVEKDPVRGAGGNYTGPERRKSVVFDDNAVTNVDAEQSDFAHSNQGFPESECFKVLKSYRNY